MRCKTPRWLHVRILQKMIPASKKVPSGKKPADSLREKLHFQFSSRCKTLVSDPFVYDSKNACSKFQDIFSLAANKQGTIHCMEQIEGKQNEGKQNVDFQIICNRRCGHHRRSHNLFFSPPSPPPPTSANRGATYTILSRRSPSPQPEQLAESSPIVVPLAANKDGIPCRHAWKLQGTTSQELFM